MNFRIISLSLCLVFQLGMLFAEPASNLSYQGQQRMIQLRMIGHQLLLSSGDSISRVMPIQEISEDVYQIHFETTLGFMPAMLQAIVVENLPEQASIVGVYDCTNRQMVHGFEIQPDQDFDLPCSSRELEVGCYYLQIHLSEKSQMGIVWQYMLPPSLLFAVFCLFVIFRKRNASKVSPNLAEIQLASFRFDPQKRLLHAPSGTEVLSEKESQILDLMTRHANQLIERTYLEDEIWGKEGVITGRSLDVFVSRLRKKLKSDPAVQIRNVRGRGYQLEIDES
ncbi:MAG: winged helix-turn-helix domain-containing protein [Bacteroidota bacterium]